MFENIFKKKDSLKGTPEDGSKNEKNIDSKTNSKLTNFFEKIKKK